MLGFLLAAITVTTSFEGGSLGRVTEVAPAYLRCAVKGQSDQNNRNRQANWYYFRLDNLPRTDVRIDFTDLVGEYNFRSGSHAVTRNTRPVFSYDQRTWKHFSDQQTAWDEKEVSLTVRFTPERGTLWVAHSEPYTKRNLDALLAGSSPHLRIEPIGKSFRGRDLLLLTITDAAVPEAGKRVVWLVARQHAWETGTSWMADGAVRSLLSSDPEAVRLRRTTIFKVLPMFDPDGVAEGAVRFNVNGYDNNRNWDAVDPKPMPEIAAARKAILAWTDAGHRIDVFIALHNTESVDYVEGPVSASEARIKAVATELVSCLRERTSFYDPKSPRDSTPKTAIEKGRMTVNQALFAERKVSAFLMEAMVEKHPELGRPRTSRDFAALGEGLAACLAAAAAH